MIAGFRSLLAYWLGGASLSGEAPPILLGAIAHLSLSDVPIATLTLQDSPIAILTLRDIPTADLEFQHG